MAARMLLLSTSLVPVAPVASNRASLAFGGASRASVAMDASTRIAAGENAVDVVVIGSGIGGLSCASLLSKSGRRVAVLESHSIPGGCAHGFERQGFYFDSGPSLWNGMAKDGPNPLRQILSIINEDVPEWIQYPGWQMILPEGRFFFATGDSDAWKRVLKRFGGPRVLAEWEALEAFNRPIATASRGVPALLLRDDPLCLFMVLRYASGGFLRAGPQAGRLTGPFSAILEGAGVTDEFIRRWFDYLSFALSGLDASATLGAAVSYTFADLYEPGCLLDYPKGGSGAVVDALIRGIRKHGGVVQCSAHVDQILLDEEGSAVGVQLRNGTVINARQAVVSNAAASATVALLPEVARPAGRPGGGGRLNEALETTPSFMHLHLGIRGDGLDASDLDVHYSVILDDFGDIELPQNMVIVSIPTLLDPGLAPPGHHVIHAYYAADEPYGPWEGLDRRSAAYRELKARRAEDLWKAVDMIIPGVRDRLVVELVASPLTHERFLRRPGGSYGPTLFPADGTELPWARTQVKGLFHCGDSCYPGIGVPAVAASGAIAAFSIMSLGDHVRLVRDARERGII